MLKGSLHFNRYIASFLVLVTAGFGVKTIFFSSAASTTPTGAVRVTTYRYEGSTPVRASGVEFWLEGVGQGQTCSGSLHHNSGNDGQVTYTDCGLASRGGDKTYRIYNISRDGYTVGRVEVNTPGRDQGGNTFLVRNKATYEAVSISVYLNQNPAPAPSPQPAPSPTPSPTPTPVDEKTGKIQVTTYEYKPDGSKVRVGNVTVHVQSVDFATTDSAHSCSDYNKVTDSAGGSVGANANYGQAHYVKCWTASGGTKAYILSYVVIPSGYTFRSFHVTNGKFRSGQADSQKISEQFDVKANSETTLEVWMNKNNITSPGGGTTTSAPSGSRPSSGSGSTGSGSAAAHEVITQTGTRFVAANNNQVSKELAAVLTATYVPPRGANPSRTIEETIQSHVDDSASDPEGGECDPDIEECDGGQTDDTPPSAPTNLKATQDKSGSIVLTWDASVGDPKDEEITYTVDKFIQGQNEPESTDTPDLNWTDDSEDIDYPQVYIYRVTASDADGNTSNSVSVTVQAEQPTPNVPVSVNGQEASQQQVANLAPGSSIAPNSVAPLGPVEIKHDNSQLSVEIPAGSASKPLSCDIATGDNSGEDVLADLGSEAAGGDKLLCRDSDGQQVEEFGEDVELTLDVDESELSGDEELYGYDGNDWEQIDTVSGDEDISNVSSDKPAENKGTLVYTAASKGKVKGAKTRFKVKTKKPMKLAVVKPKPQTNLLPFIFIGGFAVASLLIVIASNRVKRRVTGANFKKGFDVDLLPMAPRSPDVSIKPSEGRKK